MQRLDEIEKWVSNDNNDINSDTVIALIKTIRAQHEALEESAKYFAYEYPGHENIPAKVREQTEKDWGTCNVQPNTTSES